MKKVTIMSTKPRATDATPRRQRIENRSRRAPVAARTQGTQAPAVPHILDAVCDQHGGRWIRYGTQRQAIWFAVADLITTAPEVFRRLSTIGATCLTMASQSVLKHEVEAIRTYRGALVAARPGWLNGNYVFGDGTVVSPPSDTSEVIVAFDLNPKFTPRGTLAQWQAAVAPFVAGQPIPYFCLALSLSGAVLRFLPAGYLNPQVEIVSQTEGGKSSMGALAASVWAGNPDSDCGGGESWDFTLNQFDLVKQAHRDGFAFLDEGNLACASLRERREFARQVVFKGATTGSKRRMGDPIQGEHARVALLSTTNTALADLLEDTTDVRDAAQSRMITIRLGGDTPHGLFTRLPPGHATARVATEAMRGVADQFWGTAARRFVQRLVHEVERDEERLRASIAKALTDCMGSDDAWPGSARIQKTFALVTVTAVLARRADILPKAWGDPKRMIRAVAHTLPSATVKKVADPLAAVRAYLDRNQSRLVDVASLANPLSKAAFEAAVGFLRCTHEGTDLMIPAARFQAAFPNHEPLMRGLRDAGLAQTEGGRKPKLTIKTPKTICDEGRVYCIRIDRDSRR